MFTKKELSYTKYSKRNKNVVGVNYDAVNEDRAQIGNPPLPNKTVLANEKTGEVK